MVQTIMAIEMKIMDTTIITIITIIEITRMTSVVVRSSLS